MSILYTSSNNGLNPASNCYSVGIVSNICNTPEIAENCISEKHVSFCFENENNVLLGDEATIFNDNELTELNYSFIINTNNLKKNLSEFAKNRVLLNNQIMKLMEGETNMDLENFPYEELASSQNEEEFKQALANAGVIKYSELGDLLIIQGQNALDFQANNKDFTILKTITKQVLITNAINAAKLANPMEPLWTPEDPAGNAQKLSCFQQWDNEKSACSEDTNVDAIFVASAFLGGPVAGGLACLGAMYKSKVCLRRAREKYNLCISQ